MQSVWNISPEPRAHRLRCSKSYLSSAELAQHTERSAWCCRYISNKNSIEASPTVCHKLSSLTCVYYISIRSSICISTAAALESIRALTYLARSVSDQSRRSDDEIWSRVQVILFLFECFKALMRRVLGRASSLSPLVFVQQLT